MATETLLPTVDGARTRRPVTAHQHARPRWTPKSGQYVWLVMLAGFDLPAEDPDWGPGGSATFSGRPAESGSRLGVECGGELHDRALHRLLRYRWPGNVRQLSKVTHWRRDRRSNHGVAFGSRHPLAVDTKGRRSRRDPAAVRQRDCAPGPPLERLVEEGAFVTPSGTGVAPSAFVISEEGVTVPAGSRPAAETTPWAPGGRIEAPGDAQHFKSLRLLREQTARRPRVSPGRHPTSCCGSGCTTAARIDR